MTRNRPYYYPSTDNSQEHHENTKRQMGNPSTEESQRQVFSARVDVRAYADAWRFLEEEWGEAPQSRSDAVDWAMEVVAQLYSEVSGNERTESFEEAYEYLARRGIDFEGSERTKKVKTNNLKQESVQSLMAGSPKKRDEAESAKPAANIASEIQRLKEKHPDWSDNKIVKEAKRNLDIPLETEKQDREQGGPIVTGSSEGLADIPDDVDTAEDG